VGKESKTERYVEWEGREKQRDVVSVKVEQNREMDWVGRENNTERYSEGEGRAKQRDVLSGKGKQNRGMC